MAPIIITTAARGRLRIKTQLWVVIRCFGVIVYRRGRSLNATMWAQPFGHSSGSCEHVIGSVRVEYERKKNDATSVKLFTFPVCVEDTRKSATYIKLQLHRKSKREISQFCLDFVIHNLYLGNAAQKHHCNRY